MASGSSSTSMTSSRLSFEKNMPGRSIGEHASRPGLARRGGKAYQRRDPQRRHVHPPGHSSLDQSHSRNLHIVSYPSAGMWP